MSAVGTLVLPTDDPAVLAFQEQAQQLRERAVALAIDSPEAKIAATDLRARLAALRHAAETERIELVKPHNNYVNGINALFKRALAPVAEAYDLLGERVLAFDREQRRLASEAAAKAEADRIRSETLLREAEKAEAKGENGVAEQLLTGAVASEQGAKAAQAEAVLPSRHVVTGAGSSTVRKEWTFRLLDLGRVPLEYHSLDAAKVREAIRRGARDVPGLEIFQAETLATRHF